MAGKEETEQLPSFPPSSSSSSKSKKMEEPQEGICWRKQVDQKLKTLHSLLFGADIALERNDFSTAQILGLRLVGFLQSQSDNDIDEAFIRPILREATLRIDTARRSLIPDSDRRAFEQAGQKPGCVFSSKGCIDMGKIMQSKYFCALLPQSQEIYAKASEDQLDGQDKLSSKAPNILMQAKLTSLAESNSLNKGSLNSKTGGSDHCIIIEGAHGNSLGAKRTHMEISSPRTKDIKAPSSSEETSAGVSGNGFVTARAKLELDTRQRRGLAGSPNASSVSPQSGYGGRSYGMPRRGVRGNFVPPIKSNGVNVGNMTSRIGGKSDDSLDDTTKRCLEILCGPDGELPEKLKNLEPRLIEHVSNEIMDRDPNVRWDDIAGLEHAKKCVTEMVIWPLLRPDIFKGCRSPGRGLLLFGPPGTGKTMIGKAIAGEAKATFFYISASSLTSKWIGEGEKLVRALFGVASCRQPAVIFVDEIDSLLSQRKSEGEHESSRRLKTQFLIEMEGFDSGSEQILLIGATNRPQELDEAARRRLTKRLYIPLPSSEARAWIIKNLLEKDGLFKLSKEDIDTICNLTEGYSGSDMKNLVKDASMGPLREALKQGIEITKLKKDDMRPVTIQDFETALQEVRASVSLHELGTYDEWNKQFGSLSL